MGVVACWDGSQLEACVSNQQWRSEWCGSKEIAMPLMTFEGERRRRPKLVDAEVLESVSSRTPENQRRSAGDSVTG
jgi:hypothetical protein